MPHKVSGSLARPQLRWAIGAIPFVCAVGAPAAALSAFAAHAETLNEALVRAYQVNPQLKGARAALRAVDEQSAQAVSLWRPTLSATASAGRTWTRSKTPNSPRGFVTGMRNPHSLSMSLSQDLFRGGRNFHQWNRAKYNIHAQRARLWSTEQTVLFNVVTAYMNVVRDQAVLRLNLNNEAVLRRQLQATRDRFSVGEVTRTDVAQAQARLARARADRIASQGTLQSSRANYLNVVGNLPGRLAQPTPRVILPKYGGLVVKEAKLKNPTVIAALYDERSARADVKLIGGELLPTLSIGATVSRSNDSSTRDSVTDSTSVTATITIPLYASGSVTSRLRSAKQTVFQRRHDLIQAQRTAVENATTAWVSLESARSQVRAFQSEVRANQIALEGVRQEARAGLRTVLDVLDAQQELLTSQVSLVRSQRDRIVAIYQVMSAMGRLTAKDLRLRVKLYDAHKYFKAVRFKPWGLGKKIGKPPRFEK